MSIKPATDVGSAGVTSALKIQRPDDGAVAEVTQTFHQMNRGVVHGERPLVREINVQDIITAVKELKALRLRLQKLPQSPQDDMLNRYERELGIQFQADYRYFLKEASDSIYNGRDALMVTSDATLPWDLISVARQAWLLGVPRHWLPISESNGDYYCLTRTGEVRFWSHDGPSDEAWPDLATWIRVVWIDGR